MSKKSSNVRLGIFVLSGITLVVVILVWMGAAQYMKGATTYVTFFDESVQGLQVDSKVKYRGVEVGRVTAVRVAPDFRLIEVVMDIGFDSDLSNEMVAQLQTIGITGIMFVELDRQLPGDKSESPRIDFAAEYPIIPSKSSEMHRLLSIIDRITKQLSRIDFEGLGHDLNQTLRAVREMVQDGSLQKTITSIKNTSDNLEQITKKLRAEIEGGELKNALVSFNAGVRSFEALMKDARKSLKELDLEQTAREMREFMTTLKDQTLTVAQLVRRTMTNLRNSSSRLDNLMRRLELNPSYLIFSQPPEEAATE